MKTKKKKSFKKRIPIAPPGRIHKTKKDYNRKQEKKVKIDD